MNDLCRPMIPGLDDNQRYPRAPCLFAGNVLGFHNPENQIASRCVNYEHKSELKIFQRQAQFVRIAAVDADRLAIPGLA
ncbi:MAG: hypothetical protein QNJ61_07020 [Desulfobacterales bacterium]|nr:hypothetical protein [Desulfobacterales bacterium]